MPRSPSKRRPGRPKSTPAESRKTEALKRRFLELLPEHGWRKACSACSISLSRPTEWRRADPKFAARMELAREAIVDMLESRLDDLAMGRCDPDEIERSSVTAAIFRLKGLKPATYRERVAIGVGAAAPNDEADEKGDASAALLLLELWSTRPREQGATGA